MDYNWLTVYEGECCLQSAGNNGSNVVIWQCLHQVDPIYAHTRTERTPYANFSGPMNEYGAENDSFLDHIVTSAEMQSHHYELESERHSMELQSKFPIEEKVQDAAHSG